MGRIIQDLNYSNFKDEVALKQGKARAYRYHHVWEALYGMPEDGLPATKSPKAGKPSIPAGSSTSSGKKLAYGGVVFDEHGRILLREPKNHFDGYVWTFPKGRPEAGESPENAALRKVFEETGVSVRILAPIPGEFMGGTTRNRFFLMTPEGPGKPLAADDPETVSILWASPREARSRLVLTTNQIGRERDLAILEAACTLWEAL
jgi:ADP-ribose pyrophosphatase YjhB (NUDIX family)